LDWHNWRYWLCQDSRYGDDVLRESILTQEIDDIGFLDAYLLSGVTGTTNDADYLGYTGGSYVVTGACTSRLSELKKYAITAFTSQYFGGGSYSMDGVDYTHSSGETIVYYLVN
jgi:hypothetical protein